MIEKNQQTVKHLAIIMDGNGRWAQCRNLPREYGHIQGAITAKHITAYCLDLGIKYLSLYAFSSENWKRPKKEVEQIMFLLEQYLEKNLETLIENKIRLIPLGALEKLPSNVQTLLATAVEKTSSFNKLTIYLALSYGAQDEIAFACKNIVPKVQNGEILTQEINANTIADHLYTRYESFPDLILRTSGEHRLSNFLLFQASYSELYFTDTLWPDFKAQDLDKALKHFSLRKRRFGLAKTMRTK